MANLLPIGTCAYNGFHFGPAAETLEFSLRPVKSADGRTIKYSVGTLTIRDYITGAFTDPQVLFAITRLTQPAAGLLYTGRGFSDVNVNLGGVQDAAWGPFPTVVSCVPKGSAPTGQGQCVEITWTVTWSQPTCGDAAYIFINGVGVQEYNYKLTFQIDMSGYTTRTYSGFVVIPQTRVNIANRVARVSADELREQITPPLVIGYRRVSQNFELSDDRNRLTFTIVDEEMPPNAPPSGVIEAQASHSFTSDSGSLLKWTGMLSASYEVAKGVSPTNAIKAFFALMLARIGTAAGKGGAAGAGFVAVTFKGGKIVPAAVPKNGIVIPWQFTAEESQIYGKTMCVFKVAYKVAAVDLAQILTKGGLWTPAPAVLQAFGIAINGGAQNFGFWQTSISGNLGPRGGPAGFAVFNPGLDDFILDQCAPRAPKAPVGSQSHPPAAQGILVPLVNAIVPLINNDAFKAALAAAFPPPDPASSFIEYHCNIVIETDSGTVVAQTLPSSPISPPFVSPSARWDALNNGLPPTTSVGSTAYPPLPNAGNLYVQRRVQPKIYVRLVGQALRAGYQIPVPELVSVGGQTPTLVSRLDRSEGFVQGVVGNCIVPMYAAAWNLRYALNSVPSGPIDVPGNDLFGA